MTFSSKPPAKVNLPVAVTYNDNDVDDDDDDDDNDDDNALWSITAKNTD